MTSSRTTCLLCGRELEPLDHGVQSHPSAVDCRVTHTDIWGVALTADEILTFEAIRDEPVQESTDLGLGLSLYPPVEDLIGELFDEMNLPRLGGPSSGRGWSSFALAQRCLYAWYKTHVEKARPEFYMERGALAIGTLVHLFLALYYANMMEQYLVLTPGACHAWLRMRGANPELMQESWRVFEAYRLYYAHEDLRPLAVEYDLRDPQTGRSCRYDLIGYYATSKPGRPSGTYLFEHKTSGRFDWDTIDGWANDGEVIGEAALWRRLGLDNRFGRLRGVVVNILGKQKEPKFHRTTIAPGVLLINSHFDDLDRWDGLIALCRSTNNWPRSRANCINRWGRCQWWEYCMTGEK